ncbi:hypothetical protein D9M73_174820 [compost metagenome]
MVDVLGVRLHGVGRDVQALADLLVGQPLGEQLQHRDFPRGEFLALLQCGAGPDVALRRAGLGFADQQVERAAGPAVLALARGRLGLGLLQAAEGLPGLGQQGVEIQALAFLHGGLQAFLRLAGAAQAVFGAGHQQLVAQHQ